MSRLRVAVVSPRYARGHRHSPRIEHLICPGCHDGDAIVSNLIDETPYRIAASRAATLRARGDLGAAMDVLSRLGAVRISNFVRPRYRCGGCLATFDE